MAIKPYYTSNTLIDAIKRKIAVPLTQVTFDDQDILDFAYEELMLEQVPSILEYNEEYYVYKKQIDLIAGQSKYSIPDRAIGMKLRDVFYINTQNQICQMSRISPDDKNFFEISSGPIIYPIHYYVENNSIILVPAVRDTVVGKLELSYFLRPNSLVPDEEAAICSSFSKNITVDITNLVAGDTVTIGSYVITADTDFVIGVNNSTTALNLSNYINSLNDPDLIAVNNNELCSLTFYNRNLSVISSNSLGLAIQSNIIVNSPAVPSKITDRSLVDILQTDAGHITLAYDVLLGVNSVSPTSIMFTEAQLPKDFVVGDYICARFESIIPQVPTDLHTLLAERTCSRLLSSLGDYEGMGVTDSKIKKLEDRQTNIMDMRVDGSPMKVTNFNGLLRNTRTGIRGRRS